MGSMDDKCCYNPSTNSYIIEFNKGNHTNKKATASHGRNTLNSRPKPTPSKWDDAQKWVLGLSGGGDHNPHSKTKPRNSNAEDRRLLDPLPQKGRDSCSSIDGRLEDDLALVIPTLNQEEGETKKIDCSYRPVEEPTLAVRSVCLRDMGTEMTPIGSKEPSRTGTPLRARTPVHRSPINSRTSSPRADSPQILMDNVSSERKNRIVEDMSSSSITESSRKVSPLESRAMAWDEAERTKYMARYKREEVKIQAWENHKTRKAEMEMKRIEAKAERLKSRAQEKLSNRMASTRRKAEEKRSTAEAKLNERAAKAADRADYVRKTGHHPSSLFSLKLPSLCS